MQSLSVALPSSTLPLRARPKLMMLAATLAILAALAYAQEAAGFNTTILVLNTS
jgi:hypothetical protein